jgi:hypothetical protein
VQEAGREIIDAPYRPGARANAHLCSDDGEQLPLANCNCGGLQLEAYEGRVPEEKWKQGKEAVAMKSFNER